MLKIMKWPKVELLVRHFHFIYSFYTFPALTNSPPYSSIMQIRLEVFPFQSWACAQCAGVYLACVSLLQYFTSGSTLFLIALSLRRGQMLTPA